MPISHSSEHFKKNLKLISYLILTACVYNMNNKLCFKYFFVYANDRFIALLLYYEYYDNIISVSIRTKIEKRLAS